MHNNICICVPGHYTCGKHRRLERAKAFRKLTPEQKAYDRQVDPLGAYHTDFPAGCSCHISPPCSYCVGNTDEESELPWCDCEIVGRESCPVCEEPNNEEEK